MPRPTKKYKCSHPSMLWELQSFVKTKRGFMKSNFLICVVCRKRFDVPVA